MCFNPRSRARSDSNICRTPKKQKRFQSTLPSKERQRRSLPCVLVRMVSIHAPEQGATQRHLEVRSLRTCFNPRSRARSDPVRAGASAVRLVSIHAPEQGATLSRYLPPALPSVSIHAPEQGATRLTQPQQRGSMVSIHAPEQGATRSSGYTQCRVTVSIHAPEQGATLSLYMVERASKFQSTLPSKERRIRFARLVRTK